MLSSKVRVSVAEVCLIYMCSNYLVVGIYWIWLYYFSSWTTFLFEDCISAWSAPTYYWIWRV